MNLFNSHESYFGLFESHSLMLSFNCDVRSLDEAIRKISTPDGKSFARTWKDLSNSDVQLVTTDVHEYDHFTQFIATPFGILLWRCYQVLIRDNMTLTAFFRDRKINVDIVGQTVLEWWEDKGRKLYDSFREEDDNYLEAFVVHEIKLVEKFLDILISSDVRQRYSKYTVGEFLELINDLYPRLARRSSLPWLVKWRTELPLDTMLFGDDTCGFNALPIFEGMSKIRERIVLEKDHAANKRYFDIWRETLIGYYKDGYDYGIDNFFPLGIEKESMAHLGHVHHNYVLSLCGNIDITCTGYFQRGLIIENEFPWFRCHLLREQANLLTMKDFAMRTFDSILAKNELFSEYSQWDTRNVKLVSSVTGEHLPVPTQFHMFMDVRAAHFRLVEQHFFRGHRLLLQSMETSRGVGNQIRELALIEEYNDRFIFINTPELVDVSFLISWMVPLHIAYQQYFMLNVSYGLKSKRPEEVGEKYLQSLRLQFPQSMSKISAADQESFKVFFSTEFMQSLLPVEMDPFFG